MGAELSQNLSDAELLKLARHASKRSPDPSNKVGCVITRNGLIHASGWNGPPERILHTPEKMADRSWKYPRTVHAEMRALHRTRIDFDRLSEFVLYCTHPACAACALHVVERRILRVVTTHDEANLDYRTRWAEDVALGERILTEGGVKIEILQSRT